MKKNTYLLLCFVLFTVLSEAQNMKDAIKDLVEQTGARVTVNQQSGTADFIKFPIENPLVINGLTLEEKVSTFLVNYNGIYNLNVSDYSFEVTKTDSYGLKHVTIIQKRNNVPVFDGKLRFHFNQNEELTAVNGNYIPDIKINTNPTISASQAKSIALSVVENQNINFSGDPLTAVNTTLYVFQKGLIQNDLERRYLVYEVEVRNENDVREFLYVNAHDGGIVEQFTGIAHAINRIIYEDNIDNVVWEEGDDLPGTLTIWQQNEVIASGHMYNFFKNAFGYTSYDGADAQMRVINNNPNISCPNANWNGVSTNYCNGTATDDVIAHEWGHAYTEYTSNLIYAYQSGAINESYSDIWGETIDLLNNYEDADDDNSIRTAGCGSSDRWRIGEDASAFGGAIRDMWNPPCNGDPGKVTDGQFLCGEADSGGVHINSGIPNHAYAFLVDGGTYNGQTISGIGFTKAVHIFWRAQSEYLMSTSGFNELADALEASCTDLMGINLEGLSTEAPTGLSGEIISESDYEQVVKAILAVELRVPIDFCGYVPILEATDDPCDAAINNAIFYEDWELGIGSWTVEQLPTNPETWESRDWVIENNLPQGRNGQAIFGVNPINGNCSTSLQNGIIRLESPVINIPNYDSGTFELSFVHNIATEEGWDGGNIKYSLNGGVWTVLPSTAFTVNSYNGEIIALRQGNDNPMQNQEAFTGSDGGATTGSWGRSYVNLSAIGLTGNSTIQLRWDLGTDGCNGRIGWYVDDISIYNCDFSLSVAEFENLKNSIQIFPNPSNGFFTLKNTNNIDLEKADIYDINGRIIQSMDLSHAKNLQEIHVENVQAGIYFMNIQTASAKYVVKLVIK
jgi:Zn-dependent metalloprotease